MLDRRHLSGSWLAALAAAQLPLRQLRLCARGVRAGEPVLRLAHPLCSCRQYGLVIWCRRSR